MFLVSHIIPGGEERGGEDRGAVSHSLYMYAIFIKVMDTVQL